MLTPARVAFGGGCHWCTEAVFQQLRGVAQVDQGWVSSLEAPARFAEGVVVHFRPGEITLPQLVAVHLHTHACTSAHALRGKYRSAVYGFRDCDLAVTRAAIAELQLEFDAPIVTEVVRLGAFRQNHPRYLNYYRTRPEAPFCERYIGPKLRLLDERFGGLRREE